MTTRFYDRAWLVLIALVPWLIQPGLVQPDTKVDLTLSPWRYLARSLDAWNSHSGLGEVQNQAYGYLFPMGPVYGIGTSLGLPAWAVQRVWWTLVVVVAFLGCRTLIRRWGIAGPTASTVAAAAYALSPRVLTLLSDHSVEAWPGAIAPWLLIVASGFTAARLTPRQFVAVGARVGLLTAAVGGVNATASAIAVLPALLLLAVHPVGRRRIPLLLLAAGLGAAWWVLPLLVLGDYAFPFLDYIETASITTAVTSVPNTFRGTDNWIAYILDSESHPVWQGGWVLAQGLTAIILTSVVAAIGVAGVLRLSGVVRRFALASIVLGTLAMVVGHPGFAGSPFADQVRSLLDGPLVVFRNVHKFDPLVRLPISLGLAVVLARAAHAPARTLLLRRLHSAGVSILIAAAAVPLWQGRVGSDASFADIPGSWRTAATQIDRLNADTGATLLLPSSRTASYSWGRTTDEPISALARTPVVVRASAPLGHPGATRLLDAVDALAASGQPQPGLAPTVARMGIHVIVVRRDLAATAGAGPWRTVEATLAASPGFTRVSGQTDAHRSIWTVEPRNAPRSPDPIVVSGGPEALPALLATGTIPADTATLMTGAMSQKPQVITDSLMWRSYHNGAPTQRAYGPVLPVEDDAPSSPGSRDLPPDVSPQHRPHRELIGLRSLAASSSAADPFAKVYVSVANSPFAAVDNDPSTRWLTGDHERVAKLSLTLRTPTTGGRLTVRLAAGRGITQPTAVRVNGVVAQVTTNARTLSIPVAKGATKIDLELVAPSWASDPVMGVDDVSLSGTRWGSIIAVAPSVDLRSQTLLLGADGHSAAVPARRSEDGTRLVRRVRFSTAQPAQFTAWMRGAPSTGATNCGAAGTVQVGARTYPLKFTDEASNGLRSARPCTADALPMPAGTVDLRVSPPGGAQVEYVRLGNLPTRGAGLDFPLIATTHGANPGWWAFYKGDGSPLSDFTLDGWRYGYEGTLKYPPHIEFTPTFWHQVGLAFGALVVLCLLMAALLTRRVRVQSVLARPERPRRATPKWWPPVFAVAVGGIAAGPVGIALGLAGAFVPRRWRAEVACGAMVLAGIALAAGGVVDQRSWGAGAGQVLASITLVLLAAELAAGRPASASSEPAPDARSAPSTHRPPVR